MTPHEIIDAYVLDVMRHLPRHARRDIGPELTGLLADMLAERAEVSDASPDAATTIAMLREFGLPEETAARYRDPVPVMIPAYQTGSFVLVALGGVLVQWLLSLPAAIATQSLAQWWFGAGLGAFWWPGIMAFGALAAAWLRDRGIYRKTWSPRLSDTDSINRRWFGLGLVAFAIGTVLVAGLPFAVAMLPEPVAGFFVLDESFLLYRAPLASLFWLGQFILLYAVYSADRWTPTLRQLNLACDLGWIALMAWWMGAGPIFVNGGIDAFVKSLLGLLIVIVGLAVAVKLFRWRQRGALLARPT